MPYSPSKMLFSKSISGLLPCTHKMIKLQVREAQKLMQQEQDKKKVMHDRKARDLKQLVIEF